MTKYRKLHKELIGKRFNRLTLIRFIRMALYSQQVWLVRCDCGAIKEMRLNSVIGKRRTQTCGKCNFARDLCVTNYSHGLSTSRFYRIWRGIIERCTKKTYRDYFQYGGRGIKNEWKTFKDFKKDMYPSYLKHVKKYGEKQTTIDRIDNNGNYCKENCRWATYIEQTNNTRANRFITHNGQKKTLSNWGRDAVVSLKIFRARIKRGWDIERALKQSQRKYPIESKYKE